MKEKVKELVKKDGAYLLIGFCLLVVTLLIATVTYNNSTQDFMLHLPNKSIYGLISYIGIIVLGMAGILVFRNVDRKAVPLEKIYLMLAIPLGILYCIANPLGRVPDEDYHARKAMAISYGNIFSHADEKGYAKDYFNANLDPLVNRYINSYEISVEKMKEPPTEEKVKLEYNTMALYAPICHAPQAIGMLLARIFGADIAIQCYMARIANLAIAITLVYQAIKLIPFKKHIVLFLALLPVTITEFASMAADALTIALSLFYVSYIIYLKYDENKMLITKKDIVILTISSIVIALCKIVYIPLCLLLFVIPKEKFGSLKKKNIITISVFSISVILNLIWLIYCSRFLVVFNPGVDSAEQVKYILTHPISYLLIMFRTMNVYNQILIVGLCGEGLGSYCVQASVLFIYPCIVMITGLFLLDTEKDKVKIDWKTKLIFLFIFASIVLLIYTSLYVQWTPVQSSIIKGVQARYFLPILMLVAIVLNNNKLIIDGKLSYRYILLFLLFFNLNVLSCTAYTYIYATVIDYYIK